MESTLAFSAAAWAIAMALGPVLQVRRIVDQQSSRGVSISYLLVLLIGFGLWFAYGVAAANLALIVPNVRLRLAKSLGARRQHDSDGRRSPLAERVKLRNGRTYPANRDR